MKTIKSDFTNFNFDKELDLFLISSNNMKSHSIKKDDYHIKELMLVGINGSFLPCPITLLQHVIISDVELMYSDCLLSTKNNYNGTTSILIKASYFATEFDSIIEQETLKEIKQGLILTQKKLTPKTLIYGFTDGIGYLHYTITFPSDEIQNLVVQAKFFNNELDEQPPYLLSITSRPMLNTLTHPQLAIHA